MDQDNESQNMQGQDQQAPNPQMDEPVQPLPGDNDTPFSEPSDVPASDTPIDHPSMDSGIQPEETYDQGSGTEDPEPPVHTE